MTSTLLTILNIASVAMLAFVALLSYHASRGVTRWRYCHWFGKAAIVVLALMACNKRADIRRHIAQPVAVTERSPMPLVMDQMAMQMIYHTVLEKRERDHASE